MRLYQRLRLLPVLILVALFSMGVRIGEVATGFSSLERFAFAEEKKDSAPLEGSADHDNASPSGHGSESAEPQSAVISSDGAASKNSTIEGVTLRGEEPVEWRDAADAELEYSAVTMELFEDLSARRKALDQREKDIFAREALLKAAEQELDQKFRELTILRGELESLLKKQSEEEEARIVSLVKVYEGMKSGDAARIFNTLDLDILVEVMSRMSERKLSPILADMNPDRARAVTIILAQQKQLPTLP